MCDLRSLINSRRQQAALLLPAILLGGVSNWIIAPTKGLLIAAQDGNLPPLFQKVNRHEAPVVMLVGQAIIVTLLSTLFLFMPSVNGSYWLLTALAAQLYILMYFIMFITVIVLRVRLPDHPRGFRIPGGLPGLLFVCLIGIIGVCITFVVSFMPPTGINVGLTWHYEATLASGLILMCSPPFIASWLQSR